MEKYLLVPHMLGISHCLMDPVKIFCSLLWKYGINLCGENKQYGNLFKVWNQRIWGSLWDYSTLCLAVWIKHCSPVVYFVHSHIDCINTSQTLSGSPHTTEPQSCNSLCDMRTVTMHCLLGNTTVPGTAAGQPWTFCKQELAWGLCPRWLTLPYIPLPNEV